MIKAAVLLVAVALIRLGGYHAMRAAADVIQSNDGSRTSDSGGCLAPIFSFFLAVGGIVEGERRAQAPHPSMVDLSVVLECPLSDTVWILRRVW